MIQLVNLTGDIDTCKTLDVSLTALDALVAMVGIG